MEDLKTSDYPDALEDWKLNRNVECRVTLNKLEVKTPEYETLELFRVLTDRSAPKEPTSSHTKDIHSNVEFVLDVLLNEILGKCEEKCKVCEEYVQQLRHHIIQAHSARPNSQTVFKCDVCSSIYSSPSMLIRHRNTHSNNSDILTTPCTNKHEPERFDSNNIYASFEVFSVSKANESVSSDQCENHPLQPVPIPPMNFEWNSLKQESSESQSDLEISNPNPLGILQHMNHLSTIENNLKQECNDLECQEDLRDLHLLQHLEVPSFVKCESTDISTESEERTVLGSNDTPTKEGQSKGGTRDLITHKNPQSSSQQPHKCDGHGKCFNQLHHLTQHKSAHTEERPHTCDVCGKCFARRSTLTRHKLAHNGEKSFLCDVCGKGFQHKHYLALHKLRHTGEKPHKCDVCGKCFRQRFVLTRHKLTHTGEKSFRCDVCGRRFALISNLRKHKLIHTGEKPHKCDVCANCFAHRPELIRHLLTHTGETTNNKPEPLRFDSNSISFDISSVTSQNESVSWDQCENHPLQPVTVLPKNFEWDFLKQEELSSSHSQVEISNPNSLGILQHMNHLSTIENNLKQELNDLESQENLRNTQLLQDIDLPVPSFVKYECSGMSTESEQQTVLVTHEKSSNDTNTGRESFPVPSDLIRRKITQSSQKPHKCDTCGKCFGQPHHLTQHKLTHTGEKPHKCGVCGKCFTFNSYLKNHRLTHTKEKPFHCDVCGRGFALETYLANHKSIHSRERPYGCDVCGKCFGRSCDLTRHNLTHTGEKPFHCEVCGNDYASKQGLTVHILTHTGERPYQCDACGQSFKRRSALIQHELVHTGERPYECDLCEKSFRQSSHLTRHKLLKHTGEKSFHCDVCEQIIHGRDELTKHKLKHADAGQSTTTTFVIHLKEERESEEEECQEDPLLDLDASSS